MHKAPHSLELLFTPFAECQLMAPPLPSVLLCATTLHSRVLCIQHTQPGELPRTAHAGDAVADVSPVFCRNTSAVCCIEQAVGAQSGEVTLVQKMPQVCARVQLCFLLQHSGGCQHGCCKLNTVLCPAALHTAAVLTHFSGGQP